jgi:hypothetical protein
MGKYRYFWGKPLKHGLDFFKRTPQYKRPFSLILSEKGRLY